MRELVERVIGAGAMGHDDPLRYGSTGEARRDDDGRDDARHGTGCRTTARRCPDGEVGRVDSDRSGGERRVSPDRDLKRSTVDHPASPGCAPKGAGSEQAASARQLPNQRFADPRRAESPAPERPCPDRSTPKPPEFAPSAIDRSAFDARDPAASRSPSPGPATPNARRSATASLDPAGGLLSASAARAPSARRTPAPPEREPGAAARSRSAPSRTGTGADRATLGGAPIK